MGRLRSVRSPPLSLSLSVKGGFPYSKCESACRCAVRHSPNELGILQLWSWCAVCSVGGARPGPSAKSRAPFPDSPFPTIFSPPPRSLPSLAALISTPAVHLLSSSSSSSPIFWGKIVDAWHGFKHSPRTASQSVWKVA
jgi:hypothetical protein